MTLPNFLIVGAMKAGTSSLYNYLRQHPQIFMSPVKEPRYLAFTESRPDFRGPGDDRRINSKTIVDRSAYEALFADQDQQPLVGEASTLYLYSPQAVAAIRREMSDAKIVIVLRHPVERAYSAFLHMRRDCREPLADFRAALDDEPRRIAAGWAPLWHYRRAGEYAPQIGRYLAEFPREQVGIFLFDDLRAGPAEFVRRVLEFLQADPDVEIDLSRRYNASGVPKSRLLGWFLAQGGAPRELLGRLTPKTPRRWLARRVGRWNLSRPPMSEDTRRHLLDELTDDILRTGELIGRDLSHWLA